MKRLFGLLLVISMLLLSFAGCGMLKGGEETETQSESQTEPREVIDRYSGEGSAESPYLIQSADDLIYLATITNAQSGASTCKNVYFRLEQDLNLGGMEWLPIGGCFSGHFDGNGHTVSNFKMTNATKATQVKVNSNMTTYANIGLFGMIYEGSVCDLTVSGCTVEMTEKSSNYACLVGGLYNASVTGCRVESSTVRVTNEQFGTRVGGMVGTAEQSHIENCEANVSVALTRRYESNDSDAMYVGGLVGEFTTDTKKTPEDYGTVENCKVKGAVVVTNSNSAVYSGGIAGYAYEVNGSSFEGSVTTTIQENSVGYDYVGGIAGKLFHAEGCSVNGLLTADTFGYPQVGGITAFLSDGTVKNCSFVGEINAATKGYDCYAGGIVAELGSDGCVDSCLAAGKFLAQAGFAGSACDGNAGGIVGTSGQDMTVKNCLSLGSVSAGGSRPSAASITGRRTFGSTKVDETKHGFYNCYTGMVLSGTPSNIAIEGTVATAEQLASAAFYTDTLGWSADAWNIGTPNIATGVYPTVK